MKIVIDGKEKTAGGAVDSVNGQTGTVVLTASDIEGVEMTINKVTSMSAASTDTEYPSAKSVYDVVGDVESVLQDINGDNVNSASVRTVETKSPVAVKTESETEVEVPSESDKKNVEVKKEEKKSRLAAIRDWFVRPWRKKNEHSNGATAVS